MRADSVKDMLESTEALETVASAADFDAIFVPGGHGVTVDLPDNAKLQVRARRSSLFMCLRGSAKLRVRARAMLPP
jgi:putative intracellular protease/amidase